MNIKNIVLATCAILGMGILLPSCSENKNEAAKEKIPARLDDERKLSLSDISKNFGDEMMIDEIYKGWHEIMDKKAIDDSNHGFDSSFRFWMLDSMVIGHMFRACEKYKDRPEKCEGMILGLAKAIEEIETLRVEEKVTDSLVSKIIPIINLKIGWIEKQEKSKGISRHPVALLEDAEFLRAQIVKLQGSYLWDGNNLDYLPNTKQNDLALMHEENRLYSVMDHLEKEGFKNGR